jgi:hypothetical protein
MKEENKKVKSESKRFWKTCVREDISKIFKKVCKDKNILLIKRV